MQPTATGFIVNTAGRTGFFSGDFGLIAVNPAGSLLAPTCLVLVPWLLAGAVRGRPWGSKTVENPLIGLVTVAVSLTLVSWTIRLILGGR